MKKSKLLLCAGTSATAIAITLAGTGPAALAGAAAKSKAAGVPISIRIEGANKTLLAEDSISVPAQSVDPDGNPADTCSGATAAAALQQATKGTWQPSHFYKEFGGYLVEGILGEAHPGLSAYYWSFWTDGKASPVGICGASLHAGEQILFFPQCSKEHEAECPQGLFNPAVIKLSGPRKVHAGKRFAISAAELANASGKSSPAAGVKLSAAGSSVSTGAGGKAMLRFAHAGRYVIRAEAKNAIRDETTVVVSR